MEVSYAEIPSWVIKIIAVIATLRLVWFLYGRLFLVFPLEHSHLRDSRDRFYDKEEVLMKKAAELGFEDPYGRLFHLSPEQINFRRIHFAAVQENQEVSTEQNTKAHTVLDFDDLLGLYREAFKAKEEVKSVQAEISRLKRFYRLFPDD